VSVPRVVLDANVLVSAFVTPSGAAGALLRKLREGAFQLSLAEGLLAEAADVLLNRPRLRRRYGYPLSAVDSYLQGLRVQASIIDELPPISGVVRDPDDDHVIACAVAAKADWLVSRDLDLLTLGAYRSVRIITPEQALEALRRAPGRGARGGRRRARPAGRRQRQGGREGGRQVAGPPVAEEGRAAVVPAERHERDCRRAGRRALVGQGAVEVRRLGRAAFPPPPASAPCRARSWRRSAFIAPGVVLMPSFVNLGAYVDSGTMVDTWATVGSCAQIGKNVHISGGVGIGGVLEPLQADPVIIEDDCFIGARSEVAEGVMVEQGSVLSMGVYLGASTKIVDRATGEVHCRPRAGLFRGGAGRHAGQAAAGRHAGPVALLRRDRQAGGRADPLQDLVHQRACCATEFGPAGRASC
jgi:putative PIN family toxin of toxin-antitoxin system